MAEFDLTGKIGQYLDRHLVFPLLEFLSAKGVSIYYNMPQVSHVNTCNCACWEVTIFDALKTISCLAYSLASFAFVIDEKVLTFPFDLIVQDVICYR